MNCAKSLGCLSVFGAVALVGFTISSPAQTQFDFNAPGFAPTFGPGVLSLWNTTTAADLQYGAASSFGLPAMPGGDAGVMRYPAFTPTQGLFFQTGAGPNGGGAYINQYTMIWDLLLPSIPAGSYASFFNTSDSNANDGDLFIKGGAGIGISGNYIGTINANTWHRIAATFDLTTSTLSRYIDGVMVGSMTLSSGVDGRWSLNSATDPLRGLLLLSDEDGETALGFINSFYFVDRVMTSAEIAALGGANAIGIVPEPGAGVLVLVGGILTAICRRKRA